MTARFPTAYIVPSLAVGLCGCVTAPEPVARTTACTATDARIGQTAPLRTYYHSVSGTARIVDDCTIEIDNFTYDGGGLDVRVYAGSDLTFQNPVILTGDLRRLGGYTNETLSVPLPDGVTLNDVRAIAVWCTVVNVDFADGEFR